MEAGRSGWGKMREVEVCEGKFDLFRSKQPGVGEVEDLKLVKWHRYTKTNEFLEGFWGSQGMASYKDWCRLCGSLDGSSEKSSSVCFLIEQILGVNNKNRRFGAINTISLSDSR
jgi:hypothetical protein